MKKIGKILLLIIFPFALHAQDFVVSKLTYNPVVAAKYKELKSRHNKKSAVIDTIALPFFDDFSKPTVYPDSALWIDNFAFINNSYPRAPISVGVAIMDGIDSTGYPYNFISTATNEKADYLTSKPIDLSSYVASDSVYLSFYYQAQGLGDVPETKDSLILDFRTPTKGWTKVWFSNGYNLAANDSTFKYKLLTVTDTSYFKKGFQFRFRNYTTFSGNLDHWTVDYVYLNNARSVNDVIEDIAFVYEPPSFLKKYTSVPYDHYNASLMKDSAHVFMRNNGTAKLATYNYQIKDASGTVLATYPSTPVFENIFPYSTTGYWDQRKFNNPPVVMAYPAMTDSTEFEIIHSINTSPDFCAYNDTIKYTQKFYDYYAYDDGTAESVSGLNQAFGELAVKFDVLKTDTLQAVQIYFNPAQVNTSIYKFWIAVWDDNSGTPNNLILKDTLFSPVYDDGYYTFHTYILKNKIKLNAGTYYIGMIQQSSQRLNIGFDKNTQSSIFYNTTGSWLTSTVSGSLMLRPVFGEAITVVSVASTKTNDLKFNVFPNPANTNVSIQLENNLTENIQVQITNLLGQIVISERNTRTIALSDLEEGIYFISILQSNKIIATKKLLISR